VAKVPCPKLKYGWSYTIIMIVTTVNGVKICTVVTVVMSLGRDVSGELDRRDLPITHSPHALGAKNT
jgi:hypothetical protein